MNKERLIREYMEWYKQEQLNRSGCGGPTLIACLVLLLFLITSCSTVKYVPVETVRTEYINKTDSFIQKDSVFIRDSVLVMQNGDTVTIYKTKTIYKDRWQEKIKVDTIIKTDSVEIPYPVEKQLSQWEKAKMDLGGIAFVLLIFLLIYIGGNVYRKFFSDK